MRIVELLKEMSDKKVASGGTADTILETWSVDGHGVALVQWDTNGGGVGQALFCECHYDDILAGTMRRDDCKARADIRSWCLSRTLAKHCEEWILMPIKDAILDIHRRAVGGQFLGVSDDGGPPDIGETLKLLVTRDELSVLNACIELDDEEKIELYYHHIHPYKPRFRLPKQLRVLIRRLLARTHGMHDHDQIVRFQLENLELLLQNAKILRGKQLFPGDYPDIRPEILEDLAALCLKEAKRLRDNPPKR